MVRVREVRDIDFDPCAPLAIRDWHSPYGCNGEISYLPWHPFDIDFVEQEADGRLVDWKKAAGSGLAYFNPPYGGRKKVIDGWIDKCVAEAARGTEIVGCVPASTGARWFRGIWGTAQAICFPYGRLSFIKPAVKRPAPQLRLFDEAEDVATDDDNSATFWSAVPYWGPSLDRFRSAFNGYGQIVEPSGSEWRVAELRRRLASIVAEIDGGLLEQQDGQSS